MPVDFAALEIIIGAQMQNVIARLLKETETRLTTMVASGMTRESALRVLTTDLATGGIVFGTYRNGMKNLVVNAIRGAANEAIVNKYRATKIELFRWVTVSGNPCPQCLSRQGQVETMAYWEAAGMPKSGFSTCMDRCRCILLPKGYESPQLAADGYLVKL